ncbi:MotE family protein [Hyphobacterium marinum]|uniref:Magnesium transporter MgtE intracellular domain-containing protein n=1 Tax=Hyphobacterium marinum TaxID=3116574 RepID=A0ABU7LZR1_9PROT|nr:hypothetical protein [Hyphobacterium sp. Y6023]MEE2567057.1 hypothetical protein [Hyphobacterium sp. Y6023]
MKAPVRILASIALLAGGLFVMKALDFGFGVSDAWAAYTADTAGSDGSGDAADTDTEEPFLPDLSAATEANCPAVETTTDAFAERVGASPSEIEVLRSLSERRRSLDQREAEIDTRESLLQAAEARVDERITELRALRDDIDTLMGTLNEREQGEILRIVNFYRTMEPDSAAERIVALDERTQVAIATHENMSAQVFSAIMAEMDVTAAARLTALIANRYTLPETASDLEARLGQEG